MQQRKQTYIVTTSRHLIYYSSKSKYFFVVFYSFVLDFIGVLGLLTKRVPHYLFYSMLFKLHLISHFCCCCVAVVVTFVFIYFLFCCWFWLARWWRPVLSRWLLLFTSAGIRSVCISLALHFWSPFKSNSRSYRWLCDDGALNNFYYWICLVLLFFCFVFFFWCVLNFIIVIGSGSIFFLFLFGSVCVQFYIYFPSYCCCLLYFSSFESCLDLFLSFTCACVAVACWYLCLVFWPNSTKQICKPNKCMTKQI